MKKISGVLILCLSSALFVFFISCARKPAETTPETTGVVVPPLAIKCADVPIASCATTILPNGVKCELNAAGDACQDVVAVVAPTKCSDVSITDCNNTTLANGVKCELNAAGDACQDVVAVVAPTKCSDVSITDCNNTTLANGVKCELNTAGDACQDKAVVPTKCSDYSVANNNLDQCGTKNLGKDKNNNAIKCDLDVKNNKCTRVNSCEYIVSGPDKGQSRCQPQGCFWRKEKSILGNIKENSKESCHTSK